MTRRLQARGTRLRDGFALLLGLSLALAGPVSASDLFDSPPVHPVLGTCGMASGRFLLPGTDACLRITGFVRADATARVTEPAFAMRAPSATAPGPGFGQALQRSSLTTAAGVSVDVRLPTAYGPVRLYVSLKGGRGLHQTGPDR